MILKIGKLFIAAVIFTGISAISISAFAASGSSLFGSEGCIACHTIDGQGGSVGPDLSHVGGKRSLSWIKTQIVNPGAHFASESTVTLNGKPYMAIMPSHKRMPASKVNAIAQYLESLK